MLLHPETTLLLQHKKGTLLSVLILVQLNARCGALEGLAGPSHSATVRELLEKERAVQARVSQIASSHGQSLQKGATQQVHP
jgi:hypothetical protein